MGRRSFLGGCFRFVGISLLLCVGVTCLRAVIAPSGPRSATPIRRIVKEIVTVGVTRIVEREMTPMPVPTKEDVMLQRAQTYTAALPTKTPVPVKKAAEMPRQQTYIAALTYTAALPTKTPVPTPIPTMTTQQRKEALNAEVRRIPYDSLARDTEEYVLQLVYYEGQVIQVMEIEGFKVVLRVNVTKDEYGFWEDTVWVNYEGPRVLEDDIVRIWARVMGRRTYTSIFGGEIVIPELTALLLEIE